MTRFFNNVKTALLLGLMFGVILLIGSHWNTAGLSIALICGGMMNVIAYFFSDKIALASMRGKEVDEKSAPDLVIMVQRLAENAGLPMPRVYICPQKAPNAFATGRNPRHAAVAVTRGTLTLLTYEELEGVMAHELAHVKNRDTLISCVAATIAGAISYLGWMMLWFGGGSGRGGNPLLALAMVILAPIVHVGCFKASSGVTSPNDAHVRSLNAPPEAVMISRDGSLTSPSRHCQIAEGSLSIGRMVAPPASAVSINRLPDITITSLFARPSVLPACSAAIEVGKPTHPTVAAITISTSRRATISSAGASFAPPYPDSISPRVLKYVGLNSSSCSLNSGGLYPLQRPTTSKRSGNARTMSSVWVPTEPVDPRITSFFIRRSILLPSIRPPDWESRYPNGLEFRHVRELSLRYLSLPHVVLSTIHTNLP